MQVSVDAFGVTDYEPTQAVIFYTVKSGRRASEGEFATVHDIVSRGGTRPRLGPGSPITIEAIKAVAHRFGDQLRHKPQLLREQVLFCSDDLLVWWTPGGKRLCHFDVDWHKGLRGRSRLQGVSAQLPLPPLVWALRRTEGRGLWQGIYLWALLDDKRPGPQTKLWRAPLLNLNDDGLVCWGNGQVPKTRTQDAIESWEEAFFASTFTHFNQSMPFKGARSYEVLARMVASPPEVFDQKYLIPMNETLELRIQRLLKEQ